jgi:hypothetical protein
MVEKKPAAEKKAPKGVNKSAEIRKVAAAMKEKGEKPRPVVIIATNPATSRRNAPRNQPKR